MSVIVEFTVPTDDFLLGSALATVEDVAIRLEAVVPTGSTSLPYFWATGEDLESFERHVRSDPGVRDVTRLERIGDTALYRLDWSTESGGLVEGIALTGAAVLNASSVNGSWHFRLRFADNGSLERFHGFCVDHGVPIHVERLSPLEDPSQLGGGFDLTVGQREALLLAVDRGYFSVPRGTTLSAIGEELGISQQAASKRVRRAANEVLRASLLGVEGVP